MFLLSVACCSIPVVSANASFLSVRLAAGTQISDVILKQKMLFQEQE